MPFGKGIAGHVAETGVSMNIKDAYNCEVFHSVVDRETGFHTKTVLCCAVTDTSGKRTAVIQVCQCPQGSYTRHVHAGQPACRQLQPVLKEAHHEDVCCKTPQDCTFCRKQLQQLTGAVLCRP